MSELTVAEFVTARLDEWEEAAIPFRNPLGIADVWRCDERGGIVRSILPQEFDLPDVVSESDTHLIAAHIARHDPARVLAQCAAMRQIVERAPEGLGLIRALASIWSDHADWREEWRA